MVQPGHMYCTTCGDQYYEPGDHDCIASLQLEITHLTAELATTDAKVRALGAWKIAAIEILFRLHINEAADGQDIDDARGLLDREG